MKKTLHILLGLNGHAGSHTKQDSTGTIDLICIKMISSVMKSG